MSLFELMKCDNMISRKKSKKQEPAGNRKALF